VAGALLPASHSFAASVAAKSAIILGG
jgi:hypothetical protein